MLNAPPNLTKGRCTHAVMASFPRLTKALDWFIPTGYAEDENRLKKVRLWVAVNFISAIYSVLAIIQALVFDIKGMAVAVTLIGVIAFAMPFFLRAGYKYKPLVHASMILSIGNFGFGIYTTGGINSLVTMWLAIIPIMALMFSDVRTSIPYVIGVCLILFGFYVARANGYNFPHYIPEQNIAAANCAAVIGFVLVLFMAVYNYERVNNQLIHLLDTEKKKSDKLLLNILPAETAKELKERGQASAKHYTEVTVLFSDINGFTKISEELSPQQLIEGIDECFKVFDTIMEKYNIEKIKTIGDAYMAAGGLPVPNKTNAQDVVKAALEIQEFMHDLKARKHKEGLEPFQIRIGIHTGPVVAGIVGIKKFQYDIWGDTVNTASRMENCGEVGRVNISQSTYELLKDDYDCTYRGEIEVKGKGKVKMYFVEGPKKSMGAEEKVWGQTQAGAGA